MTRLLEQGGHLAVLSLDGVDKDALIDEIKRRCAASGRPVTVVSWQSFLKRHAGERAFPVQELDRLWSLAFRLFFAGSRSGGVPVELPETFAALVEGDTASRLGDMPLDDFHATGPLHTALVELAGFSVLHHHVIQPHVADGHVVVQTSPPFKNLMKSVLMAEGTDACVAPFAAALRALAREAAGSLLAPDVGVYVAAEATEALSVRTAAGGEPGVFESLSFVGADPRESFAWLQERCAEQFEEFAAENGWHRIDAAELADDAERATFVARVLESAG